MFSSIRTSKANKELVTQLTRRLNLGTENVIARLAFSFSLAKDRMLKLTEMEDSQGKEYSVSVLFGSYESIYLGLIAMHYSIKKDAPDVPKYIKMHVDDGLILINQEVSEKGSITGNDFLVNEIEKGLDSICI